MTKWGEPTIVKKTIYGMTVGKTRKFHRGHVITPSESTSTFFSIMMTILKQLLQNPFVFLRTGMNSACATQPWQKVCRGQLKQ